MKKMILGIFPFISALILVSFSATTTFAVKPPWAGEDFGPKDQLPVHAPEPIALALIGMGASAAAGYFLGKRKK